MTNKKKYDLLEFYCNLDLTDDEVKIMEVLTEKVDDKKKIDELLEYLEGMKND